MSDAPQLGLFDARKPKRTRARSAMQRTSLEAYDRSRSTSTVLCQRILATLEARGAYGATDEELAAEIPLQLQTVNPRRGELVAAGLVVKSGRRRATQAGRSAIVWVAVAHIGMS